MGLSQAKIYLDSCIVIYIVEKHSLHAASIEAAMQQAAPAEFCNSPLVRLECLVKPFKTNDGALQQLFESFLSAQRSLDLPVSVFDAAARLRATHRSLKTPDAIHFAAALHHGCTEFWTNDDRLSAIAPQLTRNILVP